MDGLSESTVQIRPATGADLKDLVGLYLGAVGFQAVLEGAGVEDIPDPSAVAERVREGLATCDASGTILVAEIGSAIRACAQVELVPAMTSGQELAASMDVCARCGERQEAVVRGLLDHAEGWALARGAKSLVLECHPSNQEAVDFYQRVGDFHARSLVLVRPLRGGGTSPDGASLDQM